MKRLFDILCSALALLLLSPVLLVVRLGGHSTQRFYIRASSVSVCVHGAPVCVCVVYTRCAIRARRDSVQIRSRRRVVAVSVCERVYCMCVCVQSVAEETPFFGCRRAEIAKYVPGACKGRRQYH